MVAPSKTIQKKPPHIYLFFGADTFTIAEKVALWKEQFSKKYGASAIGVFDCEEVGDDRQLLQLLKRALSAHTLFSHTSLVVVKNLFSKKASAARDLLCAALPHLSENIFLVCIDEKRDAQSAVSKLFTQLAKKGVCACEEFIVPTGAALARWIADRAKKYGGSFTAQAIADFCSTLEHEELPSLWYLDSEVHKLITFTNGRPVSPDDVHACACLPASAHIFDLSDALISGAVRDSFMHAHRILGSHRSAIPAQLLRMIAFLITQFRSFLILKNMEDDRQPDADIARVLSWNPRRIWVVKKKLSRHSTASLRSAYENILDLERTIKTGGTAPLLSVDLFIAGTTKKTTALAQ